LSFSQAAIASAVCISAGPPPMQTHTASISASLVRVLQAGQSVDMKADAA
jgi:hypothetical protein